jgi:DNA-binding NtrC family response regulator
VNDRQARLRTRVLETPGHEPALIAPRARLLVEGSSPREIAIAAAPVRVGTDPGCDLVLEDGAVSAFHLEIAPTELGPRLRDLGSTNGTWVDGRRAVDVYLGDGAAIRAGETRLRFEPVEGEERIALSRATSFGALLGHGPAMRAVFAVLERAARTDATVLLLGESGTGKELAARALHDRGPRKGGPFIVLDAGAASPTLLESQLFGHARGSFTGASEAREGVLEAADGGTLVIDEIGELPLDLQPKLLRALEARTATRLGETRPRSFDVRFVASTHRNLEAEVRAGRFREDLYYRLAVVTLRMPALRERKEEIGRLLAHFVQRIGGDAAPEIPPRLLEVLRAHDWPGNVRELRNFAERFLTLPDLGAEALLGPRAAPPTSTSARPGPDALALPFHDAKREVLETFEREYFASLLARHGDNVSEAARVAGLSRQTCYRLMHKHGLDDG